MVMRRTFCSFGTAVTLGVLAAAVVVIVADGGRAVACSCVGFTDGEAFEAADTVFTGFLRGTELDPQPVSTHSTGDPERFFFDVGKVFKGQATSRQAVVTARDGASCGPEIAGRGPLLVFAYRHDDGIVGGAVDGELYSNLCSGTRALSVGDPPASFGVGRAPTFEPGHGVAAPSRLDAAVSVWVVVLVLAAAGLLGTAS